MEQNESIKDERRGKHLVWEDRIIIETMLKNKHRIVEIAAYLGRSIRCIQREVKTGTVKRINSELTTKMVYNADRGQDVHDLKATRKGPQRKLEKYPDSIIFVKDKINDDKWSPDVVANKMKAQSMPGAVCTKTLYNNIDQGVIEGVSNDKLWEKIYRRKHKKSHIRRHKKHHVTRTSIEERPAEVEERKKFGHWEIDLIVGGKDTSRPVLLTLVERKTRQLIIRKLPDKTQSSVIKALRSIESHMGVGKFKATFKSITADNGSEFLDIRQMEKSAFSKNMRVKMYYAHPYSSWERGSNENANRMIRRFIAKGRDIGKFTVKYIKWIEEWINNYPRRILQYKTAMECLNQEMAA